MRGLNGKTLSTLLTSALKVKSKPKTPEAIAEESQASSSSTTTTISTLEDSAFKLFVSSLGGNETLTVSNSSEVSETSTKKIKTTKIKKKKKPSEEIQSVSDFSFSALTSKAFSNPGELLPRVNLKQDNLAKKISSILIDVREKSHHLERGEDLEVSKEGLEIPWMPFLTHSQHVVSLRRKDVLRDKKLKWVFSSSQGGRFSRLVDMFATKLGPDSAFDLFGKLGRANGIKEYNALLKVCIETARLASTEAIMLDQIRRAYLYFGSIKDDGLRLEEETYGPVLVYFIDMKFVEEFYLFYNSILDTNPDAAPRLGYYEMLLWMGVDDEEKIQELCHRIVSEECEQSLVENYLLALCEGGREKEMLQLLESLDVTKFTSTDSLAAIFKFFGKLQREAFVKDFLIALKARDFKDEDLSDFICSYAIGDPNLVVRKLRVYCREKVAYQLLHSVFNANNIAEDAILKSKNLHTELEVKPSSESYEKLIKYCCELQEVGAALNLFEEIFEAGLTVSLGTIHHILHTCEETFDFNLVYRVYSLICDHNLAANPETFKMMISFCVKMKDMKTAHNMLTTMQKMNLSPTSNIYNIMISGCLREKNNYGALMVLNRMEMADVKPDSMTFSQLIINCDSEEDIDKYCDELKRSGVQITKFVYMSLIHAYTSCGLFEKAKQIAYDKEIPARNSNEIKSVLVQALATHGQFSDALKIYEEIKQAGWNLEPKAVISIVEHYDSDGGSSMLINLLEELTDHEYWLDGCTNVIKYCVRHNDLSSALDLLKKLKDKLYVDDELVLETILDQVFHSITELEPTNLHVGLDLLRVIKDDLGLTPPRKCLDFLLHACVTAKDLNNSLAIWKEYDAASLPHNIISYLRMYQALLASGDEKAAQSLLTKIPKDDPHVRYIIKACQDTYTPSTTKKKKKIKEKIKE